MVLRPLLGKDLPLSRDWWNNPQVSFFSDNNPEHEYSPDEISDIYAKLSREAFVFIIEHGGTPVGDCWLQRMNIERVLREFPGKDIRRIDLQIGIPPLWGKGLGTETIRLLTDYAYGAERADMVFEAEVGSHNPRSLRALAKCGYSIHSERGAWHDGRATASYDLILTSEQWKARSRDQ